jgi:anti-anti-sigma factor
MEEIMRRKCNIEVHEGSDTATIEIHGDLTASAMDDMDAAYQRAYEHKPGNIVLKFDEKSRINSTGIAIIINLVIDSRERGCKVYVTGMSRHFQKVFQLVGLTNYAEIVESVDKIRAEEAD